MTTHSTDKELITHVVGNYVEGMVLRQISHFQIT